MNTINNKKKKLTYLKQPVFNRYTQEFYKQTTHTPQQILL